ncbi:hypothetical protein OIU85_029030 [Salix viminalis]|uniref:Uncharacterized protein n=1 Tax=Salix viminalis TaxID=40686 RepID=A0A9Q0QAH1_SALVM|nr:hypothetical protein OIU85_029030 [Salix viminalis]
MKRVFTVGAQVGIGVAISFSNVVHPSGSQHPKTMAAIKMTGSCQLPCFLYWRPSAGLLKLHNDVQTCGYEDVQVMWEILRRSESELMASLPKRKQRPFWRVFVWSNHSEASSFSANHS